MGTRAYGWEPPDDLPMHSDEHQPRRSDFFADPPEEIGEITSATTTLMLDKEPMSAPVRGAVIAIAAGGGGLVGLVIGLVVGNLFFAVLIPLGLAVIGGLIAWYYTGFSHTCSYVGREGVARFTCSGSRDHISKEEVFEFRNATELRTRLVRR